MNPDDDEGSAHGRRPTRLGLIAGFVGGFLLVVVLLLLWFVVNVGRSGW